jgi:hypothetical protein
VDTEPITPEARAAVERLLQSPVARTEEAAGADAVRFLLDGLGVPSIQELKLLVDAGRTIQFADADERLHVPAVEYRGVRAWAELSDNPDHPEFVVAEFFLDPSPPGLDPNVYSHHAVRPPAEVSVGSASGGHRHGYRLDPDSLEDLVVHLDESHRQLIAEKGAWIYVTLDAETGLPVSAAGFWTDEADAGLAAASDDDEDSTHHVVGLFLR